MTTVAHINRMFEAVCSWFSVPVVTPEAAPNRSPQADVTELHPSPPEGAEQSKVARTDAGAKVAAAR